MNSHDHDHSHHHHHHHSHVHSPPDFKKAFAIGIFLNLTFVVIEVGYGYFSNSLALIADAGHNLSDVLGLILAWIAIWLGTRKPSPRFTYGFGQSSILAALINAVLLLIAVGGIWWESLARLREPELVSSTIVITVALVGIVINGFTAWLFMSGNKSDLNIRGAYLHMLADALISLGVVIGGLVMRYTGWLWLDPVISIGIGVVIVVGTWALLRDSIILALAAVPSNVEIGKLKLYLLSIPGVSALHDLHVWAMSTREVAMTVHLTMPAGHPGDEMLAKISAELESKFKIQHPTIQIETGDSKVSCRLESDEVV